MRLLCLLLVLGFASEAVAHRLDEYLQAIRVSVATDRIDLSIDLTPGVAVAGTLLDLIDTDRDGEVSKEETAAYAQRFLKELRIALDGKVLTPSLVEAAFPALYEIKEGLGVIRIKATASMPQLTSGKHAFTLSNAHLPAISVYLVNALVPKVHAIRITKQTRDELQKNYRLEFEITHRKP